MATGNKRILCGVVAICALAAGWQVYRRAVVPLREHAAEVRREVTDFGERIERGKKTIAEVQAMEQGEAGVRGGRGSEADNPTGSPVVWLPPRMEEHFGRMGLARAITRLNTTLTEPDLPDFERTYWAVELPVDKSPGEFRKACVAVTLIETVDPSIRILDIEIRNDANDPARRVMVMNVETLVRKPDAAR